MAFLLTTTLVSIPQVQSAPGALAPDSEADDLIGQEEFTARDNPPPNSNTLDAPTGVAVDGLRTYVADRDNNRVLVVNHTAPVPPNIGTNATACLGQTACFFDTPQTTSQSSLNRPAALAVAFDGSATQLFVADTGNNRVIRFTAPFASGMNASFVFGQTGYTSFGAGAGLSNLNAPQGVAVDDDGRVYIADTGNNRVLVFSPPFNGPLGPGAEIVIGGSGAISATTLDRPAGVAIDEGGNLYVADVNNHRVLRFDAPLSSGMAATRVFGQTNFASNEPGTSRTTLRSPTGVAVDDNGNLYIVDKGNNRVLQFNQSGGDSDAIADRVFGQNTFISGAVAEPPGSLTLNEPTGIALNADYNDMFIADTNNHRILHYWTPVPNPAPLITTTAAAAFSPYPGVVDLTDGEELTLFVTGSDFVGAATVRWDGTPLTTQRLSATLLKVTIPGGAGLRTQPDGSIPIVVANPPSLRYSLGAQPLLSNSIDYAICHAQPEIGGFMPATLTAGSAGGAALTITGTHIVGPGAPFVTASPRIGWNGAFDAVTVTGYTPATSGPPAEPDRVGVFVPGSLLTEAGAVTVRAQNPLPTPPGVCTTASTSAPVQLQVVNPLPQISGITPSSARVDEPFTLKVDGSGFVAGSTIHWNGAARTTTLVSPTRLEAAIGIEDLAAPEDATITVVNPAPGGGESAPVLLAIEDIVRPIIALAPAEATAGGAAFLLNVGGSNFGAGAIVHWNGAPLATTYDAGAGALSAVIALDLIALPGVAQITVVDPTFGTSRPAPFRINYRTPSITTLEPLSTTAGGPTFVLTVSGNGFSGDSVVRWDGPAGMANLTPLAGSNANQLLVSVPASLIVSRGTASISVANPAVGGGSAPASTVRSFNIGGVSEPQIRAFDPPLALAGGGDFTLTIDGNGFLPGAIVRWGTVPLNPLAGATATRLSVTVPRELIAVPGAVEISVVNPGAIASLPAPFLIVQSRNFFVPQVLR
jgi:sugar lactone lactonase YvrE